VLSVGGGGDSDSAIGFDLGAALHDGGDDSTSASTGGAAPPAPVIEYEEFDGWSFLFDACLPQKEQFFGRLIEVAASSLADASFAATCERLRVELCYLVLWLLGRDQGGRLYTYEALNERWLPWTMEQLCNRRGSLLPVVLHEESTVVQLLMVTLELFKHRDKALRDQVWFLWQRLMRSNQPFISRLFVPEANEFLDSPAEMGRSAEELLFIGYVRGAYARCLETYTRATDDWRSADEDQSMQTRARAARVQTQYRELRNDVAQAFGTAQAVQNKRRLEALRVRVDADRGVQKQCKKLIKRMAHERGLWPIDIHRWKLDPIESRERMRIRFKRFVDNELVYHLTPLQIYNGRELWRMRPRRSGELLSPALMSDFLREQMAELERLTSRHGEDELLIEIAVTPGDALPAGERVLLSSKCASITPFHKREGTFLIADKSACYFTADEHQPEEERRRTRKSRRKPEEVELERKLRRLQQNRVLALPYEEIQEVHKRRHMLKYNALEIFLISGKRYLFAFESPADRELVYTKVCLALTQLIAPSLPRSLD